MSKETSKGAGDDTKEFQVPASDQRGHSIMLSVRIPPSMDAEIEEIFANKKFPYKVKSDLIRHALLKHLRWLRSMQPSGKSVMPMLETIVQVTRREEDQHQFHEVIDKVIKTAISLEKSGHLSKARQVVDEVLTQAEKMPDRYWSEKYRKEIIGRLGHLMKGRPAGLRPETMEEEEGGGNE